MHKLVSVEEVNGRYEVTVTRAFETLEQALDCVERELCAEVAYDPSPHFSNCDARDGGACNCGVISDGADFKIGGTG